MTFRSSLDVWLIDLERDGLAFMRMADRDGVLSPADRRRVRSFAQPVDAVAFTASRAGLRLVFDRLGGAAGAHLQRTRSGKPFVAGLHGMSLSHTGSHVAIAANRAGAIGVDIETIDRRVPEHRLISRVAALLGQRLPPDQLRTAAWTVVEAWTKFHGLTLADMLDSPGHTRALERAMEAEASDLRVALLHLPAGLVGACWYEGPVASIAVRGLEPHGEYAATQSYPNALA